MATDLTPAQKEQIQKMSYEEMLEIWRFAPAGDSRFVGSNGDWYRKVMLQKKEELNDNGVSASKAVGWDYVKKDGQKRFCQ